MKGKASRTHKANIQGSPNHSKIDADPVPDHRVSTLPLSWSSRVVLGSQNGNPGPEVPKWFPAVPKIEGPSPPNGNPEEPKGADGRGRSPQDGKTPGSWKNPRNHKWHAIPCSCKNVWNLLRPSAHKHLACEGAGCWLASRLAGLWLAGLLAG